MTVLLERLALALEARAGLLAALEDPPRQALRLFNGFYEGWPDLAVDLYGRTLVLHNYADPPEAAGPALEAAQAFLLERLPFVQAVVLKPRRALEPEDRRGRLVYGQAPDRKVREGPVWYALDLTLNRDASLYLDTRLLRAWAYQHLAGQRVLNTFAYTGSLGVAAAAGGAARVVQLDLNRQFLNLAKDSYALNGLPVRRADFLAGDFWSQVNALKRAGELFDCVLLDPPFFSTTGQGVVDLNANARRVINKVRPLVAGGGRLVAINNALFVSGAEYLALLEELGEGGYLELETIIPAPDDFTGYPATRLAAPPADPAPFNHPTKIAVLRVKRKG